MATHQHPLVFISYSRRDFHFAESAAAILAQDNKIEPWFDAHHLHPGIDWSRAIDSNLNKADALLLIASPAAFASSYVAKEWRHALKRDIPLYIAMVEAAELPPELTHCPVYELRSNFWQRVREIGHFIATKQHTSTASSQPKRFILPFPLIALLILAGFIGIGLLYIASIAWELHGLFASGTSGYVSEKSVLMFFYAATLTGIAITTLIVFAGMLYRRTPLSNLGHTLGMGAVFLFLSLQPLTDTLAYAVWFWNRSDLVSTKGSLELIGLLTLITYAVVVILLTRSRTINLWLPTGEGYYALRQRVLGLPVIRKRKIRIFRPAFRSQWRGYGERIKRLLGAKKITFAVYNEATDEPIARVISDAAQRAGLIEKTDAQWVFVLISSMTDWKKIRTHHQDLRSQTIFVLIDNVALPVDAEELRRYQWLDFREQLPEGLYNVLIELIDPQATPESAAIPFNPQRFRAPQIIKGLIELCRTYLIIVATISLAAIIFKPSAIGTWLLAGVGFLLVWCLIRLMFRTATRKLTKEQFAGLALGISSLLVVWFIIFINTIRFADDELPFAITMLGIFLYLSVILTLVRIYFHVSYYWLPTTKALINHQLVTKIAPPLFTNYTPPLVIVSLGFAIILFTV